MLSLGDSYSLGKRGRIGSGLAVPTELSFIKVQLKTGKYVLQIKNEYM